MLIPEDRQKDVIDLFWIMLRRIEMSGTTNRLDEIDIECGYRLMRDLGVTTAYPYCVEKGEQK